jgi:hypothetical protein
MWKVDDEDNRHKVMRIAHNPSGQRTGTKELIKC